MTLQRLIMINDYFLFMCTFFIKHWHLYRMHSETKYVVVGKILYESNKNNLFVWLHGKHVYQHFIYHYLIQYLMFWHLYAIIECEFECMRWESLTIAYQKCFIQWHLLIPMKPYLLFIIWTKTINARKIYIKCYNHNVLIRYCFTSCD